MEEELLRTIIHKEYSPNDDIQIIKVTRSSGSGDSDNFIGQLRAFTVEAKINGVAQTFDYMIKSVPEGREEFIKQLLAFEKEANMYELVIPCIKDMGDKVGLHSPRCFFASDSSGIIVMENLKIQGYTMMPPNFGMRTTHIQWAVDEFARLHAYSHVLMSTEKGNMLKERMKLGKPINLLAVAPLFEAIYKGQVKALQSLSRSDLGTRWEAILPQAQSIIAQTFVDCESKFPSLIHGDGWTNNFMFKSDGDGNVLSGILLDWQFVTYGSPATDLAIFFGLSIAPKERQRSEKGHLQYYYDRLAVHARTLGLDLSSLYPFTTLCEEYEKKQLYSYLLSAQMLPIFYMSNDNVEGSEESGDPSAWEKLTVKLAKEKPEFAKILIDFHEDAASKKLI